MHRTTRRRLLAGLGIVSLATLTACVPGANPTATFAPTRSPDTSVLQSTFEGLEAEYDARLGVYAINTGTGEIIEFRANERFSFASTYKALAAAALLDQNTLSELEDLVTYSSDDLVTYSPVTETSVGTGMTLRELAAAAVQYSDNTAGNLLLDELGGPAGFEAALTEVGDNVTQSDREEPELNEARPGDDRDTSTPRALADDLRNYVLADALEPNEQALLSEWLKGNTTGNSLIRAGVPRGWVVGDKTGAAEYGTRNDIAVIWRPSGAPIVLAILSDRDTAGADYDDKLIAAATAVTIDALVD